ncbi:MAG: hypothetical protein LBL39_04135 [Planctomycetaceae bacterium]|nr:hypothetical protein [Planctomycetaceae bacterium]
MPFWFAVWASAKTLMLALHPTVIYLSRVIEYLLFCRRGDLRRAKFTRK